MLLLAVMCLPKGIPVGITPLIIFAGGQTPSGGGLAAKYTDDEPCPSEGRDEGSEEPANGGYSTEPSTAGPNVIIFTDFESDVWHKHWSGGKRETVSVVAEARSEPSNAGFRSKPAVGGQSLQNKALRIKVPKGEHYGASIEYEFKERMGSEPEEIYPRFSGDKFTPAKAGATISVLGTTGTQRGAASCRVSGAHTAGPVGVAGRAMAVMDGRLVACSKDSSAGKRLSAITVTMRI